MTYFNMTYFNMTYFNMTYFNITYFNITYFTTADPKNLQEKGSNPQSTGFKENFSGCFRHIRVLQGL